MDKEDCQTARKDEEDHFRRDEVQILIRRRYLRHMGLDKKSQGFEGDRLLSRDLESIQSLREKGPFDREVISLYPEFYLCKRDCQQGTSPTGTQDDRSGTPTKLGKERCSSVRYRGPVGTPVTT